MKKTKEFIFANTPSELILNDEQKRDIGMRICDPYVCAEEFGGIIDEVRSMRSYKIVDEVKGQCIVMLKNGEQCVGTWRNGKREGQGTVLGGTRLESLGVYLITGNSGSKATGNCLKCTKFTLSPRVALSRPFTHRENAFPG